MGYRGTRKTSVEKSSIFALFILLSYVQKKRLSGLFLKSATTSKLPTVHFLNVEIVEYLIYLGNLSQQYIIKSTAPYSQVTYVEYHTSIEFLVYLEFVL